ncbi:TonB-dependent receptor [Sphingosinicella sp. CPCC 101087]|uniref:TonB-dependent receptor n=1 Tax=Sphingosinicella sp. CPCC 101087 TaxID=2497754 RepID=UPI001FB14F3F|nr:TonB-dependent receptor [Sphingosinicella sp. CPCC 101087]
MSYANCRTRLPVRSSIVTIALLSAAAGWAQAPEPSRPADEAARPAGDAATDDSTIVITGSRIRGVEAIGSNVIAVDQERIAQTPVLSTNDLLRRVPQVVSLGANRQGGTAQNGAANATRGAGINLRGIGTNATLLLYDGKRFPPQGTQGQYTDPSVLPAIALARVEVVADGASAIYGSDAIAGVVNFILRKNFDGIELRARSGFTEEGHDEQQLAGIAGYDWDSGSVMLAAEYTRNSPLWSDDLDFYQADNRFRGGRDLRPTFCNPGTISVGGSTYAIPRGGVSPANVGDLVAGTANRCFYETAVIPSQERINVVAAISQDIGERIRVFADGFYSYRDGIIPANNTFTATVPSTNPFFVSPVPGATSVNVTYSLVPELGLSLNPYRGESWNVMGGVEADLFADWVGTVYYSHGESEDVADRRLGVNNAALNAALADTNPATALNVFGGLNNPETLARIRDNFFIITGRTRLDVANLQLDGSVLDLPGGAVRLAVGGEYRKEYTFTDLITGSSASQTSTADSGSRNVKAVFGELFVPIVGSANARPGLQELSLSLAARYEHYSDFGDTTNPKLGLTYRPFRSLTLRGTYGTSFRAPTFTEVSTVGGGAGLYYDTLPFTAGNLTGIGIAGGNPDLQPETATTWSVGAEFAPRGLGLVATATYFDIDYKDQIQALRGTPGILTNPLYASFVTLNPTPEQVQALLDSGLPINSAINPSLVQFIVDGRRQNLGRSLVSGVDFGLTYQWEWGDVGFDVGAQGTYFTRYKFEPVPGVGASDVLGTINFSQKFRSQADLGVRWGEFQGRVTWNHLAGYRNTTVNPVQQVGDYDTVDLFLGWDISERFRFSIDVRNLFDEDPPFVDSATGYDPQSSNPVPRLISVTAGVRF